MTRNGRAGVRSAVRCAIYTRKSTEEGLQQEFNSLDAQREAGEAYIASQAGEGWIGLPQRYDDGGYTGGNMERPALARLLEDIEAGQVDCVVVYKVDRLSRSLLDFARMMETFEKHRVSFVSVTQQFNTAHSMGRLMLDVLLSFAQFEREIISERTRDKIAAARRKGKWSGGRPILGYDVDPQGFKLAVNPVEADQVRRIFELYLERRSLIQTAAALNALGWTTKRWTARKGHVLGGRAFDKCSVFALLTNVAYCGKVRYKQEIHDGEHAAIVDPSVWQRANDLLRANGRAGGMHVRNRHGALLKGLLHCASCDLAMTHSFTSKGARAYRYYVCGGAQKRGWKTCPTKSVPAEAVEQFVVQQIRSIGRDPALITATLDQAREEELERLRGLEVERTAADRDCAAIERELARPSANGKREQAAREAELHLRLEAARQRVTDLDQAIADGHARLITRAELEGALGAFDSLWAELSPREQNRVLGLLIRRMSYDGAQKRLTIGFHPSGIKTLVSDLSNVSNLSGLSDVATVAKRAAIAIAANTANTAKTARKRAIS